MTAPYVPTVWQNDEAPDVDDVHLNKQEQGIKAATDGVIANATAITALGTRVTAVETAVSAGGGASAYRRFTKDALARGARTDGSDSTTVLQGILDEIRDSGYGEMYLPGKPGDTYNCKGLWIASGTRVVSDPGVILNRSYGPSGVFHSNNIYDSGDLRMTSWDGDLVRSDGLFLGTQTRLDSTGKGGASASAPYGQVGQGHDIRIEGLTLKGGTVVVWAVENVLLEDVHIQDDAFGVAFTGLKNGNQGPNNYCKNVLVDACSFKNHSRNGIELSTVRDVVIRASLVDGVTAGADAGNPGCGIENETESPEAHGYNIRIVGNTIRNTIGAAIGIVHNPNPNAADLIVIEGNTLVSVALGDMASGAVGTRGAFWFNGGQAGGEEVVILTGNHARFVGHGGAISAPVLPGGCNMQIVATGNVIKLGGTGQDGNFQQANFKANNVGL